MKKKTLLQNLPDRYCFTEHDGGYLLYDKEAKAKRTNHLFKGKFYLSSEGTRYVFQDNYYNTADELIAAMDQWAASLPFDAEIYNPSFRKHYMIECALYDYLESLGFKYVDDCFEKNFNHMHMLEDAFGTQICAIRFKVEHDTTTGSIKRIFPQNETRWTESSFTDLDSAIGSVNSIVASCALAANATLTDTLSRMTESRASNMLDKYFSITDLTVYTADARQKTIEYLEKELQRLKNTNQ